MEYVREAPRVPVYFTGLLLCLALIGIGTGIMDVAVPVLKGDELFAPLKRAVELFGYPYLFLHIFLHNLGIACLVPGIGLIAAHMERNPRLRAVIGPILSVAVVVSILTGAFWVVQSGAYAQGVIVLFFALEAAGVLLLTFAGLRAMRGYVPTPAPGWSLHTPAHRIAPYFLASSIVLGIAAYLEVLYILNAGA